MIALSEAKTVIYVSREVLPRDSKGQQEFEDTTRPACRPCVKTWTEAVDWLKIRGIEDIECITPDLAGVARGKMMPTSKFTSNTSLACLRRSTGTRFPANIRGDRANSAMIPATATSSSFRTCPPFPSFHGKRPDGPGHLDIVGSQGEQISYTPRNVVEAVIELLTRQKGWKPVVAPEIEFYLVAQKRRS